jgi:hypothetical protein
MTRTLRELNFGPDMIKSSAVAAEMGKRGQARVRQMAAEDERDRAKLLAELVADHAAMYGRPATASERVPLENIARGMIRIRRLEAQGRDALEERKQLAQWWRTAGLKADKPEPKSAADRAADFRAEMLAAATPKESAS